MGSEGVVGTDDYTIGKLDYSYIEQIVSIHQSELGEDILPSLGRKFLLRYYQVVLLDRAQVILGAVSGNQLLGFSQVSFSPIGIVTILKEDPWLMFHLINLALFRSRKFVKGIIMAIDRAFFVEWFPEIAFIIVRGKYQKKGIGKELVRASNQLARENGISYMTTKTSNCIARFMYENLFNATVTRTKKILGIEYYYILWETNN